MKNLELINAVFPVEFRDIICGYIVQMERIIAEYDVVVIMARKAICFYHALNTLGAFEINSTAEITSSRALSFNNLSKYSGKRIALIDDVVVEGSTLRKSLDLFSAVNIYPDIYMAACREDFIRSKMAPYEDQISIRTSYLSESNIYELATAIIRFIESARYTYNVDQPLYHFKFDTTEEFEELFGYCSYVDISTSLQKYNNIANYVIHFNEELIEKLPFSEVLKYVKIRILFSKTTFEGTLIPFVLFKEMEYDKLDILFERLCPDYFLDEVSDFFVKQENRLKIVQYVYSDLIATSFISRIGINAYKNNVAEKENFGFVFPEFPQDLGIPQTLTTFSYQNHTECDSILFNKYVNYAYDTILSRDKKPERYFDQDRQPLSSVITIDDFEQSCSKMSKLESEIYNKYAVSNLIDIFVDKGYLVPMPLFTDNTIARGYRCGEVSKLTEKELQLFSAMLALYQDKTHKNYIDRIEFEKLCVLFFRSCQSNKILAEVSPNNTEDDYYNICYTRFGPRVSQAKNKKYGVELDTAFANFLYEKGGIDTVRERDPKTKKIVQKYNAPTELSGKMASFSREEQIMEIVFSEDMAKYSALYPTYAEIERIKKETHNSVFLYARTFNEFLTLLSIGDSNKERALSLIAEIYLISRGEIQNESMEKLLNKVIYNTLDGLDSGLWKYWCYSKEELLYLLFIELSRIDGNNTDVLKGANDYITRKTDRSDELAAFITECGEFLYKVAYTYYYLAKKYVPRISDDIPNKRYFYWNKLKELRQGIKNRISNTSLEEDKKLLQNIQKEALAYVSACDLYLALGSFANRHFESILSIYSDEKSKIQQKIGNSFINIFNSEKINGEKFIFMQFDRKNAVSELESILQDSVGVEPITIIVFEADHWFDGLYGDKQHAKGTHFETILIDVIEKDKEFDCPGSLRLLFCSNNVIDESCLNTDTYIFKKHDSLVLNYGYQMDRFIIEKKGGKNVSIDVRGNTNTNVQLMFNSDGSSQNMKLEDSEFAFDEVLVLLTKIQKQEEAIIADFGAEASEVINLLNEAVDLAKEKKDSSKLKTVLSKIVGFASNVSASIVGAGISAALKKFI